MSRNNTNITKTVHYISSVALPVHLISKKHEYIPGSIDLTMEGDVLDWDMALTDLSGIPAYLMFYTGIIGINNCNQDILKGVSFSVGDTYMNTSINHDSVLDDGYFSMTLMQACSICSSDLLAYNEIENSLEVSGLMLMCMSTMEYLGIEKNNSFTMQDIIISREISKENDLSISN